MRKRKLDIVVISDVHLGTYGCYAHELLVYLSSIEPKILVLNGDIIDIWHFSASYFPPSHLKVIKKIISMASKGTEVHYIKGNHDEVPKRIVNFAMGNIKFGESLVLNLDGKRTWFFHGDIFDTTLLNPRWVSKIGNLGFRLLDYANKLTNWVLKKRGKEKFSLSSRIKAAKGGRKHISRFKDIATDIAFSHNYDTVICGHIHQPEKTFVERHSGNVLYLNSGDWVENLSALEYSLKRWKIYRYANDKLVPFFMDTELKEMDMNTLIKTITSKKEKTIKAAH